MISLQSHAQEEQKLKQMLNLCNQSKGAFDAYHNWVSTPPVLGGEIRRTSLADICDLLTKTYNLKNRVQDLAAKVQNFNTTKSNWESNILLGIAITNVAASKYYTEPEPTDPAEIEDQKEYQDMKDFYESIGSDERVDASKFKNTREQAQKMDSFQRAARQKAMLSSALICPDNSDNPDYHAIFEQQLRPLTIERERYKLKRDHYYRELVDIGPTFLRNDAYSMYHTQLQNLKQTGVIIRIVEDEKSAPYYSKRPALKEGEEARVVKGSTKIKTQKFYSDVDGKQFAEFKAAWQRRWKDYIDESYDKIDRSLDIADNCVASRPAETDLLSPDEINAFADYQRRCGFSMNQKPNTPPAFLFEEALNRYQLNSERFAALQAQVWTKESSLLKKQIVFDNKKGAVQLDTPPNCQAEPMSDAKLKETQIKFLETENQFKEIIARERIKDGMMRDEEMRIQREQADKQRLQSIEIQKSKDMEKNAASGITATDLGGSF